MEDPIEVSGCRIRCMAKGYIFGKMEGNIREDIITIRNMDQENITGLTDALSRESGFMEKEKVRE